MHLRSQNFGSLKLLNSLLFTHLQKKTFPTESTGSRKTNWAFCFAWIRDPLALDKVYICLSTLNVEQSNNSILEHTLNDQTITIFVVQQLELLTSRFVTETIIAIFDYIFIQLYIIQRFYCSPCIPSLQSLAYFLRYSFNNILTEWLLLKMASFQEIAS